MTDDAAMSQFRQRMDDVVHSGLRNMAECGERVAKIRAEAIEALESWADSIREPASDDQVDDGPKGYAFQREWEDE